MTDALDTLRPEVREAVQELDGKAYPGSRTHECWQTIRAELLRFARENDEWQTRCLRFQTERDEARKLYNDLLFAVGSKHPGESRHETARRYILNAESLIDGPSCDDAAVPPSWQGDP